MHCEICSSKWEVVMISDHFFQVTIAKGSKEVLVIEFNTSNLLPNLD